MGHSLKLVVIATAFTFVTASHAQNAYVDQDWPTEVVGTVKNAPGRFSLAATTTGGPVYVVGRYLSPWGSSAQMLVEKLDTTGATVWGTLLSASTFPGGEGVAIVTDEAEGAVYATGVFENTNGKNIVTVSLDPTTGSVLWSATYNNSAANGDDVPVTLVWDSIGGFVYVGGTSEGASGGASTGTDFVLLKYDASTGAVASGWSTPFRYNGTSNGKDALADIAVVRSGGSGSSSIDLLYVAGTSHNTVGGQDFTTIWIDPANPAAYADTLYNSGGNDVLTSLAVHATSQTSALVVATGYSTGTGSGNNDYVTVAYPYDLSGLSWGPKVYNGPGNGSDQAVKVVIDAAGSNVFVTGESWGGSLTGYDFATIRYRASDGNEEWTTPIRFDNPAANAEDRASDLIVDKNGNTYIGGKSFNGTSLDYCAVSYNLDGSLRWIERIGGVPTSNNHVLYDGTQHGADAAGCLRVSRFGGPIDHVGDVFLYGIVARSGNQFTVVKFTQEDR